jgi:hypothetical protein
MAGGAFQGNLDSYKFNVRKGFLGQISWQKIIAME